MMNFRKNLAQNFLLFSFVFNGILIAFFLFIIYTLVFIKKDLNEIKFLIVGIILLVMNILNFIFYIITCIIHIWKLMNNNEIINKQFNKKNILGGALSTSIFPFPDVFRKIRFLKIQNAKIKQLMQEIRSLSFILFFHILV